jgi:sulfur-oxidizing protein SoxA
MRTFVAALAWLPGLLVAAALPSGSTFLSDTLRDRQNDPAANPGMLWVDEGARLWARASGAAGRSCADCHGQASDSMKGVASRYPAFDAGADTVLNLEGRINRCRTEHQQDAPLAYESDPLLALTAFVARQSFGMPMDVSVDGPAATFYREGEAFFHRRQGQLNLSCANCHERHAGARLRGDIISHGLGNGFPIYRLEWQTLGSLHRRLRACSRGVRAVEFDYGSREYLGLELFLARRARGAPIETPALRR